MVPSSARIFSSDYNSLSPLNIRDNNILVSAPLCVDGCVCGGCWYACL